MGLPNSSPKNWPENERLHRAAMTGGNLHELKQLLESDHLRFINSFDEFNSTPLMWATQSGDTDMMKLLIESGAAVNTFDEFGLSPLMVAAKSGNIEAVKLLIKSGADVNAHDESKIGNTALSEIAGEASIEMIEVLIQAGANPLITGWMGLNALDRARKNSCALLESAAKKFKSK